MSVCSYDLKELKFGGFQHFFDCCAVLPLNAPKKLPNSGCLSYIRVCACACLCVLVCVCVFMYFYYILFLCSNFKLFKISRYGV